MLRIPAVLRLIRPGVATGLVLAVMLVTSAAAAERFRDWTTVRLGPGECVLHHRAVAADAGLVLADVFLAPLPAGGALISVRVPVGVSLPDGIAYRHPGQTRAVPLIWQSCNRATCLAQVAVNETGLRQLARGRSVDLAYVPVKGAVPLSFSVSLLGVTRGMAALEACGRGV